MIHKIICYYIIVIFERDDFMTTDRSKLCTGLISHNGFLTFEYPRKVVFSYDEYEKKGYDILNGIIYPIDKPVKRKGYYISNLIFLDNILKLMGYPEILESVHIERIMNEDFKKVFVESGIMKILYSCTMETFSAELYEDHLDLLKNDFTMHGEELKMHQNELKHSYQKKKRRF